MAVRATGYDAAGNPQTYTTIAAAYAAAAAMDDIQMYYSNATQNNIWREQVNGGAATVKALSVTGMLAHRGVMAWINDGAASHGFAFYSGDLSAINTQVVISNLRIRWVQCSTTSYGVYWNDTTTNGFGVLCENLDIRGPSTGLRYNAGKASTVFARNCLVANPLYVGITVSINGTVVQFCTCIGCGTYGFNYSAAAGAGVATNCVAVRCLTNDFRAAAGGTWTATYCFSSDATADDWGGAGNQINQNMVDMDFWERMTNDYPCDDWRIVDTSTLVGAGVAIVGVTDDCDDNVRADPPSVGWHEGTEYPFNVDWPAANQIDPLAGAFRRLIGGDVTGAMDVPALDHVAPPDTLRGVLGTYVDVCPGALAPIELGVIDATPYAQGCILVSFFEMICQGLGDVPYRYDFHVKRVLDGPLTHAEIDLGTYYSCSFYNEQVNPGLYTDACPFEPGVCQVALALESHGDAGDNIHLFTNQEYQICVRAVARNGSSFAEDDNEYIVTCFSSGYQGVTHIDIDSWPCLEFCDPLNITIAGMPAIAIASAPDVVISDMPNLAIGDLPQLDVHLHRPRKGM